MLAGEILSSAARRYPHGLAWRFQGASWTWNEANERANRVANALLACGLKPQDRVAFLSENSHRLAELYFALAKANLVAVPLNSRSVAREIDFILKAVEARALLVSGAFAPRLKDLGTDLSRMACVAGLDGEHGLPFDYERLLSGACDDGPPEDFDDNSIRAIKFTSGTTGAPKGVISTHRKYVLTTLNYLVHSPLAGDDRGLLVLPMTAGGGVQMLTAYAYRCCPTIILPRFNAGAALDTIERERATRMYVVPTMLAAMSDAQQRRPRDLSSMRLLEYAGGPASIALVRRAAEVLKVPLTQNYASSESGGQMAFLSLEEHKALLKAPGSRRDSEALPFGREAPGYCIRILDDEGREVSDGEVGEMVVKSDSLMSGYWRQPELTAEVLRDGWLYTGDLARREANGLLTIVDRKRDMIVTGGLNVYSAEVEGVLSEHPGVAEAAVVGEPDAYWGEVIVAYVVRSAGHACDESDLKRFCEKNLSGHKRPKSFRFVDALPKTSNGKVRKAELRARN